MYEFFGCDYLIFLHYEHVTPCWGYFYPFVKLIKKVLCLFTFYICWDFIHLIFSELTVILIFPLSSLIQQYYIYPCQLAILKSENIVLDKKRDATFYFLPCGVWRCVVCDFSLAQSESRSASLLVQKYKSSQTTGKFERKEHTVPF